MDTFIGAVFVLGILAWLGWVLLRERPDPRAVKMVAQWETIAEHAGLKGSELQKYPAWNEWGWTGTVTLLSGRTIEDTRESMRKLDSALGTRRAACRVEPIPERARDVLLRVVERDPHEKPIPWEGPRLASINDPLELGPFETGEPCRVRFANRHTLVVGTTGSGKSGLVNLITGELVGAADVEVWGMDFKGGMELQPWKDALARLATTEEEGRTLLADAAKLIDSRARLLAGKGEGQRLWRPTPDAPAVVILVDEQAVIPKALIPDEDSVGTLGRALAVTLVIALQRGTQDAIQSKILRQLCANRICLRVLESKETDLALGDGSRDEGWAPDRLTLPGKFLVRAPDQGLVVPRPARALWVDDAAVRRAARSGADSRAGAPDVPAG